MKPKRSRQTPKAKDLKKIAKKAQQLVEKARALREQGKGADDPEVQALFSGLEESCERIGSAGALLKEIIAAAKAGA